MYQAKDPESESAEELLSRGFEPVGRADWVMLVIAALDVLLLLAKDVYGAFMPTLAEQIIVGVDLVIVGIFAIEFLTEMFRASSKVRYTKNHWYEVVGLVPIAHWGFRAFRLVRLLRYWVVMNVPAEQYHDRSWHAALVRGIIGHYRGVLLEEITDPIVLASINAIEGPLTRARFAGTIGDRLDTRRDDLHTVVREAVETTKGVGPLLSTKAGRRLVVQVTDEVLDQVILTLRSDELNEVLGESIQDVLNELREKVREKEYRVAGGSRLRPAFGPSGPRPVEGAD